MPGLFGYWCQQDGNVDEAGLKAMAKCMQHTDFLNTQSTILPGFGAGLVYLDRLIPDAKPATDLATRYHLWLDGEFINRSELITKYELPNQESWTDARLALTLFQRVGWKYLVHVNGIFNIALYDQLKHSLTIVSDRYGLRPLYWIHTVDGYGYAGELKALLKIPGVQLSIDPKAIVEWFSFSQLLDNSTWIKGASMFPMGTIRQIDDKGIIDSKYWSWEDIKQQDKVEDVEVVEELGRLWIEAVERRLDEKRVGVFLSGGLDSRSVVAAIPNSAGSITAITFGEANCYDLRVAKQVARIKRADHHFIEINSDNWLEGRFEAVWRTDGMVPLIHLHGARGLKQYHELLDIDIQSFAGDLILGGSYLSQGYVDNWEKSFSVLLNSMSKGTTLVDKHYSNELLRDIFSKYAALRQSDYLFLDNRVRRFTNCGTVALRSFVERRFPTYDNDLIEFVYSLRPEIRLGGQLYKDMLLDRFPEYYVGIPWQYTGLPISAPAWHLKLQKLSDKISRGARFLSRRLDIPALYLGRGFTRYDLWMRAEPARSLIKQILLPVGSMHSDYVDHRKVEVIVESFMNGNSRNTTPVALLLTFEIYLRQLYDEPMNYDNKNS